MVNFGIVYGLSAYGLADRLQIPQRGGAEFIDALPRALPGGAAVHRGARSSEATEDGPRDHAVRPQPARSRSCARASRQTRSLGERLAVNTVIQGTAADIIKVAMVRCRDALREAGLATRLVLQIHDELLFEGPEDEVDAAREIVRARDGRRVRARPAARRWTSASARTGWRRSEWHQGGLAVLATAFGRRPGRACRRRSTPPSAGPSAPAGGRRSRSRSALVVLVAIALRRRAGASARSASAAAALVLPDRRPAGCRVRDDRAGRRCARSAPAASPAATIAGQLTLSVVDRPSRGARPASSRACAGRVARGGAAGGGHRPDRAR